MKKFTVKPKLITREIIVGLQNEKSYPDRVLIGNLAEAGGIVPVFHEVSSEHVISIFGKRGSGKSYTLGSIVEGLCTKDKKTTISSISKKKAILLFDTLGIFQWMRLPIKESSSNIIKSQLSMQKKWYLKPEILEILLFEPKQSKTYISLSKPQQFTLNTPDLSASDWGYLLDVDIYSDRIGQLLNEVYIKVTQEGWSNNKRHFSPINNYSSDDMINCLKSDSELSQVYHSETRRALLQQLLTISHNPLFQKEGTKLENLLRAGCLSIILLHKIPDDLRLIIVSSLIKKIIENRIHASEIEKHKLIVPETDISNYYDRFIPPTWIVIDEAQNILPSERKNPAGELLVKLVREGRNFGISFMFTTQQPSAIDSRILAQVDTMIIHRLTVQQDIEYIKRNLKSALPDESRYSGRNLTFDESLRLLDVGQAFVSNTELERGFFMNVRPRISIHGGF